MPDDKLQTLGYGKMKCEKRKKKIWSQEKVNVIKSKNNAMLEHKQINVRIQKLQKE